ncbi:MAG TPA: hypothetical protein PLY70_13255 [Saprospiraceae bacterium]|mgnify:CR=1 FL=1|nr:hypothetical protein [Saprospiraceae bacterium]HPN68336.1 hypothetical protein [Saprospiraceae bacterium]
MVFGRTIFVLGFYSVLFSCCGTKPVSALEIVNASLYKIGPKEIRENIKNIVTVAECIGPNGKYRTIVHSDDLGYTYFKQIKDYDSKQNYEAVIYNDTTGVVFGDTLQELNEENIFVIRSHEFHQMLLSINKRYNDFEISKDTVSKDDHIIHAKTALGKSCSLFFNKRHQYLDKIVLVNPDNANEFIITQFTNWKLINQISLPYKVSIKQGDNYYHFEFKEILINSTNFIKIDNNQ